MCCSPTGSGKTAAFLLPILHKLIEAGADSHAGAESQQPQCVIVTPTKELAIQIRVECGWLAKGSLMKWVSAYETDVHVYGYKSFQIRQLQKGCNILICTPGRMLELLDGGKLSFTSLKYLVFDEADRIIGLPDIQRCISDSTIAGTMPPKEDRQVILFSSSFPDEIQFAAQELLSENYLFVTVGGLKRKRAFQEEEEVDDIKKNMRINIQTAKSKLAAKEIEFKRNEENRQREEKLREESLESDMSKIDSTFEKELYELEERRSIAQEEVLKIHNDEMSKLRIEKEYEKNSLAKLKEMEEYLSRKFNDINKEGSAEKTKLDAAISTLKCPACWNTMKPPTKIWMCPFSHIVCESCKAKLVGMVCPSCRVMRVTLRAYMAEEFARSVFIN